MKKFLVMLALTMTFAAVAGSAATSKDMPFPGCYPCDANPGSK
jgi:hypothetical protein